MTSTPLTTDTKESRINLRASAQDKALIEKAAALRGMKVSQFFLTEALKKAKSVLEEEGIMVLAGEDRQAFVSAFLEPHNAPPYMQRAIKAHKPD